MTPEQVEEFLGKVQEIEELQAQVSILEGQNLRLLNEVKYQRELLDRLPALFEGNKDERD